MFEDHLEEKLVTVFASREIIAEIEAETIHALLESAGVPSVVIRGNVQSYPPGGAFRVKVLASHEKEAIELIEEAQRTPAESETELGEEE